MSSEFFGPGNNTLEVVPMSKGGQDITIAYGLRDGRLSTDVMVQAEPPIEFGDAVWE